MRTNEHEKTPIFAAVRGYVEQKTIPFHVPGHKQGKGLPELTHYLGKNIFEIDLTCMEDLDNICNPTSAIQEAQKLAAETYGADHAYFLVNGTTCGIQGMIMSVCQPGDKIIIPRNVHKSAISGLILSGATPIYLEPEINDNFGIAMGISPEQVEQALICHPDAKAVFVINPTYYGIASNIKRIVEIAHSFKVPVLADEAHGAHLCFNNQLPLSAMEAGADLSAVSTHKLAGSMTQSSMLLLREGLVDPKRVKSVLNLTQTTSPSYILLVSLDFSRKQMALSGKELVQRTIDISYWMRAEIANIDGLELINDELINNVGCYAVDPTKITVNVKRLGLSGYEVEKILRQKYQIQVELSDLYNLIFLVSLGDCYEVASKVIEALKEIADLKSNKNVIKYGFSMPALPEVAVTPQQAFYSETKLVKLEDAVGEISAEAIMAYPPGIPIVCPGERMSQELIDYIKLLKMEKAELQGTEDPKMDYIKVLSNRLVLVSNLGNIAANSEASINA
ncbi:MAG: aminotransferase class I/II-fold pyridoxal phosphate-dependent enzyme [Bacillota bacterium]|nr:aminotransferase class I/II-fold pyridoxal phosphate-dependent enzyme [Bacillota bacterium]